MKKFFAVQVKEVITSLQHVDQLSQHNENVFHTTISLLSVNIVKNLSGIPGLENELLSTET